MAFFKAMLNRYLPGDRVNDEDALDLAALLERHTEYISKVGSGVNHFEVMMTEHGTQCFRIIRTDGSGTDFSYRNCITQRPPSRKQEVSQAFRRAVRFDLYKARDAFFAAHGDAMGNATCAVTGERITRGDAHMDHRPPMTFEVIVTTFLCSRGLSLDSVPLTTGQDDQVSPEVTDQVLAEAFRTYHAAVARLDLVRNTINLAQASRHRLKDSRASLD
ncbi:DCL family protein [Phaeobacter italicus]|uniref:DCL family protein n=1 Tax=Phaeobacter italicus TaxID=481446 RepID=UPI001CD79E06|nr:DCL family protein [Phaeobacter italicus]MCA0858789.1 DCL family protein [Phaeobacter italicus]